MNADKNSTRHYAMDISMLKWGDVQSIIEMVKTANPSARIQQSNTMLSVSVEESDSHS